MDGLGADITSRRISHLREYICLTRMYPRICIGNARLEDPAESRRNNEATNVYTRENVERRSIDNIALDTSFRIIFRNINFPFPLS